MSEKDAKIQARDAAVKEMLANARTALIARIAAQRAQRLGHDARPRPR